MGLTDRLQARFPGQDGRLAEGSLWHGQTSQSVRPVAWGWLFALVVVGSVLRAVGLNQQLWYDEIVMLVNSARHPLPAILTQYASQNQHILYSILARLSLVLFGEHPWTLRLPAVLFGVASIPAVYWFARLVTTRREALLAATLMTFSYHHIWFSQNARGYTALLLWTLLASCLFLRGASLPNLSSWFGYAVVMALGMYTHLTMGFVALGHAIVYLWLLAAEKRSVGHLRHQALLPLVGFLLAGFLTLLLYAPLLPQVLARTVAPSGPSMQWEWKDPLWLVKATVRGLRVGAGGSLLALAVGVSIALTGIMSYWRTNRHVLGLMLFPAVVTAVVILVLQHNLWPRFFFFEIGFAFLFVLRGLMVWAAAATRWIRGDERFGRTWATAATLVLSVGFGVSLLWEYRYPKQDFVGAMHFIDASRQAGEPVVTVGLTSFAYGQYFRRDWLAVEKETQLEEARSNGRVTWLVYIYPTYIQARYPEIWRAIQHDFRTVRTFPGTLLDGQVYVCRAAWPQSGGPIAKR